MIVLIIFEHSYFRRKKNHSLYWALFHHRPNQKDIITSALTNTIMDFTLVPTMKHFTVINSIETDGMKNAIHCSTMKSLFYTSVPT